MPSLLHAESFQVVAQEGDPRQRLVGFFSGEDSCKSGKDQVTRIYRSELGEEGDAHKDHPRRLQRATRKY